MLASPDMPQPGQPWAAPRIKIKQGADGKKLPAYVYPYQIVKIKRVQDLELALEHYGHPIPTMQGSIHEKGPAAQRYMVEWVFPALRWYCKVYNQPLPEWLNGNGWADGMSDKDMAKHFGPGPLDVHEFREDKQHAGKRG